jgi:hypothetical protein
MHARDGVNHRGCHLIDIRVPVLERLGIVLIVTRASTEAKILLLGLSFILCGCFVRQLTPTTHVVTIEPNGSETSADCVPATQIAIPSARVECRENGADFVQECRVGGGCIWTKNGKVFRECTVVSNRISSKESDCTENGIHISRVCDRGWTSTTLTCRETKIP